MKASPGPTVGAVIGPCHAVWSHIHATAGRLSPVFRLVRTEYSQDANWRQEEEPVQTIGIVLNVGAAQADEFEQGFRAEEAPIWDDLHARGLLVMATLTRLDISTRKVDGAVQFLVVAIFATDEDTTPTTGTRASRPGTSEPTRSRSRSHSSSAATRSSRPGLRARLPPVDRW